MNLMDPQNVPPQTKPPEPVVPPPQSKPSIVLIMIVFLLILIVGVSAYYLLTKQTKTQTNIIPTQTPAPTTVTYPTQTSTTTEETKNWKTYTNQDIKFSIKYPNDWTLYTCINGGGVPDKYGTIPCSGYIGENNLFSLRKQNDLIYLYFISNDQTNSFNFNLLVSNNLPTPTPSNNVDNLSVAPGVQGNINEKPDVIVGGISSKRTSAVGPGSETTFTTTKKNDLIFNFSWDEIYWDKIAGQKADKIYESILASFKFL